MHRMHFLNESLYFFYIHIVPVDSAEHQNVFLWVNLVGRLQTLIYDVIAEAYPVQDEDKENKVSQSADDRVHQNKRLRAAHDIAESGFDHA